MTFLICSHYNKIQSESYQWRWKLQTMRSSARYEPLRAVMASYSSPYLQFQAHSRQLIQFYVKKKERKKRNFKAISEQINSPMRRSLTGYPFPGAAFGQDCSLNTSEHGRLFFNQLTSPSNTSSNLEVMPLCNRR